MLTGLTLESQMMARPGRTGFSIDSAKSSCKAGGSIARGKNCRVLIDFAPTAAGAAADNLIVTGNFTNSGQRVPLLGIGR